MVTTELCCNRTFIIFALVGLNRKHLLPYAQISKGNQPSDSVMSATISQKMTHFVFFRLILKRGSPFVSRGSSAFVMIRNPKRLQVRAK